MLLRLRVEPRPRPCQTVGGVLRWGIISLRANDTGKALCSSVGICLFR